MGQQSQACPIYGVIILNPCQLFCIHGTHLSFCPVEGAGIKVLKVKQKSRTGPRAQLC